MQGVQLANAVAMVLVACLGAAGGYAAWQLLSAAPPAEPEIVKLVPPKAPPLEATLIGTTAPEFALPDLAGTQHRLSEWRGKTVLVNFWATWCAPCREEMPMLESVHQQMRDRGLVVVGVAIDDPGKIGEFVDEFGINFTILAADPSALQLTQAYGNTLGALPYSVLIDTEGTIRYLKTGILTEAELTETVEAQF